MEKRYSGFSNVWFLLRNIIKNDKTLLLIILISIPVGVIIPLLEAYLPKVVIDSVQGSKSFKNFLISILYIIGTLLLLKVAETTFGIMMNSRGGVQRIKYMTEFFKKSIRVDYQYTSSKSGLEFMAKVIGSVGGGDDAMTQQLPKHFSQLSISIIGIVFFGSLIIKIQPILLLAILVSGIINYFYGRYNVKIKEWCIDKNKEYDQKIKYLREKTGDFRYSKDMRLYRMNEWFLDTYKTIMKKWYQYSLKERNADLWGQIINIGMILIRDGLTYMFLIHNYLNSKINISEFIFLLGIVKGFSDWVIGIITQYNTMKKEAIPISDYRIYMEKYDESNNTADKIDLSDLTIELKNVSFRYQESNEDVIKNINLKIYPGEKLAIVGVNGSGKTTLVSLIMGLLKPTEGCILLGGRNINEYNRSEYYKLFSTVFQDVYLLPETIEDIITNGDDNKDIEKIDKALMAAGLYEVVNQLPNKKNAYLMKSVRKNAVDLSGGQNQKLMFARALYKDSKITILDEPTAALDPIAESEIYEGYHRMIEDKTAIFISHRLSSTKFCDRIIFLEDGKILENGSHRELMDNNGKYREMFDIQAYYYKDQIGGEDREIKAS